MELFVEKSVIFRLLHSKMVFVDYLGWIPGNVKTVSINFVHLYDTYITGKSKFMEHLVGG